MKARHLKDLELQPTAHRLHACYLRLIDHDIFIRRTNLSAQEVPEGPVQAAKERIDILLIGQL